MELAIDTSTGLAGIALSEEGRTQAELIWHCDRNHTVELIPAVKHLLNQMNKAVEDIQAVFVARGPGSFNGLRVGVSTAKGLAYAGGIPVVGVSTLEVEAYAFAFTGLDICPVHYAGRGELAAALYRYSDEWKCLREEHITTAEKLCGELGGRTILCGEVPLQVMEEMKSLLGELCIVPDPSALLRRPGFLAELGWRRLCSGRQDDPAALQPIYLRKPPITQSKKGQIKK